ncbi:MAG: hypothetical protein H7070_06095 [Saprospiraceae bacterium]|nr:hypothetical protein [Pyrinomonadaceae bacterium]
MKKFLKRFFLVLIVVIVLVQIPFIYRRYQTGKLAQKIGESQTQRIERAEHIFNEYKGIIHAHTSLGGHSTGGFDELIAAANSNDLDFVLMTEHWSNEFDTSALTLNGVYGKTLFVGGNEVDTADSDRFLMIPGSADAASFRNGPTTAFLEKTRSENKLAFVTYPEKLKSWDSNFDGIEVFSLHTSAKQINPFIGIFDLIWSYPAYPELTLASYFKRPDANLQKFDETAAKRKISLFAGTDAHSNIGFHLFGDDAGNKLINIKIDPYETIFRLARAHVLIEKDKQLTREHLIEALKTGRSFIGFDVFGESSGFSFVAESATGNHFMGDDALLSDGVRLKINSPNKARFVVFRNGEMINESADVSDLVLNVYGPGAYRVEVYLDSLGPPFDKMPWIISNPIYVR